MSGSEMLNPDRPKLENAVANTEHAIDKVAQGDHAACTSRKPVMHSMSSDTRAIEAHEMGRTGAPTYPGAGDSMVISITSP